jgi:hypothetical protein
MGNMNSELQNGVRIYTPRNFEDLHELTRVLYTVTKPVIVDCQSTRVLPSHFISLAISKANCIVLVNVSRTAINIFKTIGVEKDIHVSASIKDALLYLDNNCH